MLDDEPANDEPDVVVTVRLALARADELRRRSNGFGKDVAALATEYLAVEVKAEHGLRDGPWLRK